MTETAISIAAQTGRLDFVSALLGAIALLMTLGGIFAFLNLRRIAQKIAKEEAEKISKERAEEVTNTYLQNNLEDITESYRTFAKDGISSDDAEIISLPQREGEER